MWGTVLCMPGNVQKHNEKEYIHQDAFSPAWNFWKELASTSHSYSAAPVMVLCKPLRKFHPRFLSKKDKEGKYNWLGVELKVPVWKMLFNTKKTFNCIAVWYPYSLGRFKVLYAEAVHSPHSQITHHSFRYFCSSLE